MRKNPKVKRKKKTCLFNAQAEHIPAKNLTTEIKAVIVRFYQVRNVDSSRYSHVSMTGRLFTQAEGAITAAKDIVAVSHL